jgi:hypothetical protein
MGGLSQGLKAKAKQFVSQKQTPHQQPGSATLLDQQRAGTWGERCANAGQHNYGSFAHLHQLLPDSPACFWGTS